MFSKSTIHRNIVVEIQFVLHLQNSNLKTKINVINSLLIKVISSKFVNR